MYLLFIGSLQSFYQTELVLIGRKHEVVMDSLVHNIGQHYM